MATANYMTMESFPLFAREFTSEIKCCKHCGLYQDSDNKISVLPGHYYGVQFYVETTDDPTEMDNEDCRYYFDMYRSVAIRRYNSEVNKVCRILRKLAKEYGFDEAVSKGAVWQRSRSVWTGGKHKPLQTFAGRRSQKISSCGFNKFLI